MSSPPSTLTLSASQSSRRAQHRTICEPAYTSTTTAVSPKFRDYTVAVAHSTGHLVHGSCPSMVFVVCTYIPENYSRKRGRTSSGWSHARGHGQTIPGGASVGMGGGRGESGVFPSSWSSSSSPSSFPAAAAIFPTAPSKNTP